jgi:arylsulfatase A-like enzyme
MKNDAAVPQAPSWLALGAALGLACGLADGLHSIHLGSASLARGMLSLLHALATGGAAGVLCGGFVGWSAGALSGAAGRARLGRVAILVSEAIPVLALLAGILDRVLAGHWIVSFGASVVVLAIAGAALSRRRLVPAVAGAVCLMALAWVVATDVDLATRIERGSAGPRGSGAGRRPNLLLIVLDTTRADHMSVNGYARPTTPFLEELARRGTVYLNAIAPAPWTVPVHASLFTGQQPRVHQATTMHRWLEPGFVTLAEILHDVGYRTVAFSCNPWVGRSFNLDQGFEQFFDIWRAEQMLKEDPVRLSVAGRASMRMGAFAMPTDKGAQMTNRLAARWLSSWQRTSPREPFFMFINYLETHQPYDPPQPFRSRFAPGPVRPALRTLVTGDWFKESFRLMGAAGSLGPDDHRQLSDLYDAEMAYEDSRLRELFEDLERRGVLDDTLVVIVGDHGENLGEHGGLLDHCFSLHQTVLHVPLVAAYRPLFRAGLRHGALVSTLGVFATLLEAAGARPAADWPPAAGPLPRDPAEAGAPFVVSEYDLPVFELSTLAAEAPGYDVRSRAVGQRAIQDGVSKVIQHSDGVQEVFDLEADPGEATSLGSAGSVAGARLLHALDGWVSRLTPPPLSTLAARRRMDAETRESLRALGYVQ